LSYSAPQNRWSAGVVNRGLFISGILPTSNEIHTVRGELSGQKVSDHYKLQSSIQHRFSGELLSGYQMVTVGVEPEYTLDVVTDSFLYSYDQNWYRPDFNYSGQIQFSKWGSLTGFVSSYQSRLLYRKKLVVDNISIHPEICVSGPTYWSENGYKPVRYSDYTSTSQKIEPNVHLNIGAHYRLLDSRVKLSLSMKNIGEKYIAIPHGNLLGMVIVTNIVVDL